MRFREQAVEELYNKALEGFFFLAAHAREDSPLGYARGAVGEEFSSMAKEVVKDVLLRYLQDPEIEELAKSSPLDLPVGSAVMISVIADAMIEISSRFQAQRQHEALG